MSFDFSNRRVVVCGGSRGIGRSIALAFAAAGADVSICARGSDTLETTRAEIARPGPQVNNASGFGMGDDETGWSKGLSVDVMAMVRASHAALPMLEQRGEGASIIHISSISGFRASTRTPAYAAVKAAMISYTASQAAMLAPKRIRVNCIAPGSIEFDGGVWEQRRTANDPLYDRVLKSIPFGRLGAPEEVAEVALFLASVHARWVTGQTIAVDGGQLLGG
jgi:3-oxoacyl-[acyl-carrier protein] reductase